MCFALIVEWCFKYLLGLKTRQQDVRSAKTNAKVRLHLQQVWDDARDYPWVRWEPRTHLLSANYVSCMVCYPCNLSWWRLGWLMMWSWILAVIGVAGIYFVGRKTIWGWLVLLFNETLWIVYAVTTKQYGFIFSAIAYAAVYIKSYLHWTREENER